MEETLRIGQLADRAGVGVETVRFYEREGLLAEPPRRASGYRMYPPDAVVRLRFIRRAKELGFSLREIDELLALRTETGDACSEVVSRLGDKLRDVEERLADLRRVREALLEMDARCRERDAARCAFLEALERTHPEAAR